MSDKSVKTDPKIDRTGGRGDLPSARHDIETPPALKQRENESDTAYLAFLLYAMQNPADRSQRLTARSLSTAESNVRHWRNKFTWKARIAATPNVEYICLNLYRRRMDEHVGQIFGDRLRLALDAVLDIAGFASLRRDVQRQRTAKESRLDEKVETSEGESKKNSYASSLTENELEQIDPARYMQDLADRIRQDHLKPEDVRRQILIIDATLGLIAKKVRSGELRVRVSDIPSLLKARAMLTGSPMDAIATAVPQAPTHQHAHIHIVESVRMRDARKSGDQVQIIDAMKSEVDDLQVILNAVPRAGGK